MDILAAALVRLGAACVSGVSLLLRMVLALTPSSRVVAGTLCCAVAATAVAAEAKAEEHKRSYRLPRGEAAAVLAQFATECGRPILFMMDAVRGEQTNAIIGTFTPREALDRLLAGTALVAVHDPSSGGFIVNRRAAPSKQEQAEAQEARGPPEGSATPPLDPPKTPQTNPKESPPVKKPILFALLAGWLVAGTPAATAQSAGTIEGRVSNAAHGSIEGRVFDAQTGRALKNARASIDDPSPREATTNDAGGFHLSNVAPGRHRITVSYIGLAAVSAEVEVTAGASAKVEFNLKRTLDGDTGNAEVIQLKPFTVATEREMAAQAIALNERRNAANVKNVVALEEFGDRGSENIGEYLLFVPGVAVVYTGAEPDTISVRGIPSLQTGILIDGGQVASGLDNSRNVSLRHVPMANVSRIEITKVPTPDTSASGLGGTVNLITSSGFDKRNEELSYQAYWNFHNKLGVNFDGGQQWQFPEVTARFNQPSAEIKYSKPVNDRLAVTASVGRNWRINPDQVSENSTWNLSRLVQTNSVWARLSQIYKVNSAQAGLDWRLTPKSTLSFSYNFRDYFRSTGRTDITVNYGADATGGRNFTQGSAAGTGIMQTGLNWNVLLARTHQLNAKYRYRGAVWRLDASLNASYTDSETKTISRGFFNNSNAVISNLIIRGDGVPESDGNIARRLSAVDLAGRPVDIFDGGNYALNSGTSGDNFLETGIHGARVDLAREWGGAIPISVKIGSSFNEEERDRRAWPLTINFRPNGASDVASRLARNFDVFDAGFLANPPNFFGTAFRPPSNKKFYELYQSRPDWFVLDLPLAHQNLVTNSRRYTEQITGNYLRLDARFFDRRLWIATGVRHERTSGRGEGPLDDINAQYLRGPGGQFIRDASNNRVLVTTDPLALRKLRYKERGARSNTSYGDFYPSLNSSFAITDSLLLRVAYARTIGRPDLNFITPGITISDFDVQDPTITVNNPSLRPWTADNYDIALESYNIKDGFGSVGVFQKDIKDFFGAIRTPVTRELLETYGLDADPVYNTYSFSTRTNVGDAQVRGVEFGYRQSLTFLPEWASGIQVFGNYTKIKVAGANTADFSDFSPETISAGVNFVRKRYYIKATYSYQGETRQTLVAQSASIPAGTYNFRGEVTRVGFSAQYDFSRRLSVYISMPDVKNVPAIGRRYAPGTPEYARTERYQVLGYYTTIGVKGKF